MKRRTINAAGLTATGALIAGAALVFLGLPSGMPPVIAADIAGDLATAQVITVPAPTRKYTYGETSVSIGAVGGSSGNPVTATSDSPETCVTHEGTQYFDLTGTGTCWLTFHQSGGKGYEAAAPTRFGLKVEPQHLTVWVKDVRRDADALSQPKFEVAHIFGLRVGDTADVVHGLVIEGPPLGDVPGRYPLHGSGATADNYEIEYDDGALTVDPVIKVAGLPDGLTSSWTFNGSTAIEDRVVVPYDSVASYSFAPLLRGSATSPMYITTSTAFLGKVVRNETAHYNTMRQLLEQASTDSSFVDRLANAWKAIEWGGRYHDVTTENYLHSFASEVRSKVREGGLSTAQGANIERHVQVVYSEFGFAGTV